MKYASIIILSFLVCVLFYNVGFITIDSQDQFQEQIEMYNANSKSNLVVDFLTFITPAANAQPTIEENSNNDTDLAAYGYYP